ncbi:MaoC/PaaZ C-terminal domain-containing protein [Roseibium sp. RKSG952]|uniref:MaoC/PaaZ C-terminal domain-containing protein n=1 Tax=Roseibium sp. RKSG952 TaxID=2529384 RepID=UPI0012BB9FCC|nr:MaoC/PaaZ C-terminal domain-containing protein [Roseibium sp. RKSG952]MTH96195.1 3-alpha,7-alpha,12-alpha-trihydroxy-5-beta-cholest-24-enoyl-CoA hydratase [Roseibium sp. RKSG952]
MTIDPDKLLAWPFEEVEQTYTVKDAILYALGTGFGHDPVDQGQLPFVFEEAGFKAVPTMAVVLAGPGFWFRNPETGIDWHKILHGEQAIRLHKPLPPSATVTARTRITDILDKGAEKGALIYSERDLIDKTTGNKLATLSSTTFARGNGGFGGNPGPQPKPHTLPDRMPDAVCDLPTLPQSALLYRLSGDPNPLHADPAVATDAGFTAPILHGLCTLGIAGHAVLRSFCKYDTSLFKSLKLRFSSPVYPGETIRTEMWLDGDEVSFRSRALERGVVVLDNGRVEVGAA